MVLAIVFKEFLNSYNVKEIGFKIIISAVSFCIALGLYRFEMAFNPELKNRGNVVAIAKFKDIPKTIINNSKIYLWSFVDKSSDVWIILYFILIFLFFVVIIYKFRHKWVKSIVYTLIYCFLASILSYGVYLIFPEQLVLISPRYGYGLPAFISITLILLLNFLSKSILSNVSKFFISVFCYYMLTFSFIYSASLYYQNESFERQSIVLTSDLNNFVSDENNEVMINKLFNDSVVYENTSKNYPILKSLVPSNTSLYWPNLLLFRTYSGLKCNLVPMNEEYQLTNGEGELLVKTYLYEIYIRDGVICVYMR